MKLVSENLTLLVYMVSDILSMFDIQRLDSYKNRLQWKIFS